jgi:hypothetical protein
MQALLLVAAVVGTGIVVLVLRRRRARARQGSDSMAALYASDPITTIAAGRAPDYAFLDDYLSRWDRFARGENDLMPALTAEVRRFNTELAFALRADPRAAMGRAILYPLLQVGGFVPLDSAVGEALSDVWGRDAPPSTLLSGRSYYFAGELYFWWEANRSRFERYAPYEEWRDRDFARKTAVPMYEGMRARGARR